MGDYVVDTNVLLCASAAHPGSPFDEADHVPDPLPLMVLDWLSAFRADPNRHLVLDELFRIYDEYRNKLTDQDYGLLVVGEKLQSARMVPVEYDADGFGVVPVEIAMLDASDRKLAAAAIAAAILGEGGGSSLVNATDTDWYEVEAALAAHGVVLEQVLGSWCRAKHEEKQRRKAR